MSKVIEATETATATAIRGQPRGRPRSAACDHAISEATLALLEEEGYAAMTMQAVAARAGVSTATLYRRWASKQDLVVATLACGKHGPDPVDTGSLAQDLRALLQRMAETFHDDDGELMKGIIGEAVRNPALGRALREAFEPRTEQMFETVIGRAVARGEIPQPEDLSIAASVVTGPIFERWLIRDLPIDDEVIGRLVPMLLRALDARVAADR